MKAKTVKLGGNGLPIGLVHANEWNALNEEEKRRFNAVHAVDGIVVASVSYEYLQTQLANLHQSLTASAQQIAALKEEHARTITKLEDRHAEEICNMKTRIDEWRGRYSAAKLFIATLLKGEF